jgi:HIRAN domain-containing protein
MTIPVLLMECPVAGFQFHEGEIWWKDLRAGQPLELVREPGNRHDARAIRVHWRDTILGYVPREANFALPQMLDRGERIDGRISLLRESGDPWQRVMMQLILHANAALAIPNLIARAAHKCPSSPPPKAASPAPKSITYTLPIPDSLESLLSKDLTAWLATKEAIKRASAKG